LIAREREASADTPGYPLGRPIRKLPSSIEIDLATCTTESLYTRLSATTGLSCDRLRLTKGSDGSVIAVKKDSGKDVMVEELGLLKDSVIFVKDLGRSSHTIPPARVT
jgi:very-long-chain enoyl-CoA reductase